MLNSDSIMLFTQTEIKFSLKYSKLLKIVLPMICGVFFTTANANSLHITDQLDETKSNNSYFLDVDNLQRLHTSCVDCAIYIEKENPGAVWVVFYINSWMTDFYKAVASVVAAELHKRIDGHALVPPTKFLIKKNTDGNGYYLWGSIYKKFSSTTPLLKKMQEKDFDDFNNAIYSDYNLERNIGMWRYLGLPVAPNNAVWELSEDNKFARYDYYKAFQYHYPELHKNCFCTSDFLINDYNCDIEKIKIFEQELHSKHKETLEKIIAKIKMDSKKYLEGDWLQAINKALNEIMDEQHQKHREEL